MISSPDHHQAAPGGRVGRLVLIGVIAALFFSSTFILNRHFYVGGGHWAWTASLRYFYTWIALAALVGLIYGWGTLMQTLSCFRSNLAFWILTGGVGFGCFYLALCYGASYASGWVVATSWQSTIVISPIVLLLIGKRVSLRGWLYSMAIFAGVLLVYWSEVSSQARLVVTALSPVLIAAICYPLGNTLCGYAKTGDHSRIRRIENPVMSNTFCRVLLMASGAIPVLLVALCLTRPGVPTADQLYWTAFIALSTGVVGTSLFLQARHAARTPFEIAAVDATQSAEVPFALAIEAALLSTPLPGPIGWFGLTLVLAGIIAYGFSGKSAR